MNSFKASKTIDRLNQMVDNAIDGRPIENGFDESKLSAIETKLSQYLKANNATRTQLGEEKNKINELISDISHQTKTPLSNILLYTQLLSERELSAQDKKCVNALEEQTKKLNFLISSLVKASRLEAGIISVNPQNHSITNILENVVEQGTPNAEKSGVLLSFEKCNSNAFIDPKWTIEALYNIVDNAIKYTKSGGSVKLSTTTYQLFCRVDVSDTGIGISELEIPKIFTRFYRSPQASNIEGVGIGLYLAREIIAAQGGYIKVSSKANIGSVFSVFLPIKN